MFLQGCKARLTPDDGQFDVEGGHEAIMLVLPGLRQYRDETILHFEADQARTPHDWLEMIRELDQLIAEFCQVYDVAEGDEEALFQRRKRQPLAANALSGSDTSLT